MKNKEKNMLSQTATKVRFNSKIWSGIKTDRSLRKKLADDVNINNDKHLLVSKHLVGFNSSKYFRRITGKVRSESYYPLTCAWDDSSADSTGKMQSGWRLCANSLLDQLQESMEKARTEFFKEVDGFCKDYPRYVEEARHNLGDAFDENDYPKIEEIRERFRFSFELEELPSFSNSSDIRLNVSESMRQRIVADTENRMRNNVSNIFKTTVDALLEQVDHISEKVESYDPNNKQKGGFFKNSSFDKLRKAVEVMPSINKDILGDDKQIKNAHQNLLRVLASIDSIDDLRGDTKDSDAKRKKVASDLKKAVDPLKNDFLSKLYGVYPND
jgi:hypothetical protein|tara:strand:+ start:1503 stop:2486 length:984 start_codon:yes stop_codon:yes gene_type:complete